MAKDQQPKRPAPQPQRQIEAQPAQPERYSKRAYESLAPVRPIKPMEYYLPETPVRPPKQ